MTPTEFVQWSEQTFGRYTASMRLEVEAWLRPHDTYFIAALREVALREHPSTFGKPPGVHELDAWKIEAYQRGHTLEAIEKAHANTKRIESVPQPSEAQRAETDRILSELAERRKAGGNPYRREA